MTGQLPQDMKQALWTIIKGTSMLKNSPLFTEWGDFDPQARKMQEFIQSAQRLLNGFPTLPAGDITPDMAARVIRPRWAYAIELVEQCDAIMDANLRLGPVPGGLTEINNARRELVKGLDAMDEAFFKTGWTWKPWPLYWKLSNRGSISAKGAVRLGLAGIGGFYIGRWMGWW
jgi:hypothetical protein